MLALFDRLLAQVLAVKFDQIEGAEHSGAVVKSRYLDVDEVIVFDVISHPSLDVRLRWGSRRAMATRSVAPQSQVLFRSFDPCDLVLC